MGQALCSEHRASRRFQGIRITHLHHAGLSARLPGGAAPSAASKACTEAAKLLGRGRQGWDGASSGDHSDGKPVISCFTKKATSMSLFRSDHTRAEAAYRKHRHFPGEI